MSVAIDIESKLFGSILDIGRFVMNFILFYYFTLILFIFLVFVSCRSFNNNGCYHNLSTQITLIFQQLQIRQLQQRVASQSWNSNMPMEQVQYGCSPYLNT